MSTPLSNPRRTRALFVVLGCALGCKSQPASEPAASDLPPTGIYEVTTTVVADDCEPAYAPPPTWRTQVVAGAEPERAKVNLALSAVPPSTSTRSTSRSDFLLEPGYSVRHSLTPDPRCRDFSVDYEDALTRFDARGFTVTIAATFGDPVDCAANTMPSRCATKVSYDYVLVEHQCAAECTQGARSTTKSIDAPTMEIDCRCPE